MFYSYSKIKILFEGIHIADGLLLDEKTTPEGLHVNRVAITKRIKIENGIWDWIGLDTMTHTDDGEIWCLDAEIEMIE